MLETLDKQIEDAQEPPKFSDKSNQNIKIEEKVTKTKLLEELKEKYPYGDSPFKKFRDRDPRQYSKLVSTKDLNVAEFVLKWEHDHNKRIHKNMAWELLTKIKEESTISDSFLQELEKKFEEK